MLTDFALIILSGMCMGAIFKKMHMPSLIGMIFGALVFRMSGVFITKSTLTFGIVH